MKTGCCIVNSAFDYYTFIYSVYPIRKRFYLALVCQLVESQQMITWRSLRSDSFLSIRRFRKIPESRIIDRDLKLKTFSVLTKRDYYCQEGSYKLPNKTEFCVIDKARKNNTDIYHTVSYLVIELFLSILFYPCVAQHEHTACIWVRSHRLQAITSNLDHTLKKYKNYYIFNLAHVLTVKLKAPIDTGIFSSINDMFWWERLRHLA